MPFNRSATADLMQASEATPTAQLGGKLARIIPSCVIWYFEYRVLVRYTEPGTSVFSVFTGPPSPVPTLYGNCLKEYDYLTFTFVATIIYFFTDVVLQILAMTKPCGGILVAIVGLVEAAISLFVAYISIEGIYTTGFAYKSEDIARCEDLHNTAWWIYIGLALIGLPLACSLVCVGVTLTVGARAREPVVVTPTPEEVSYQKLPHTV